MTTLLLFIAMTAHAQIQYYKRYNLEKCEDEYGRSISDKACDLLKSERQSDLEYDARRKIADQKSAEEKAEQDKQKLANEKLQREGAERRLEEHRRQVEKDKAHLERWLAESADLERKEQAAQKKQTDTKKAACGTDYQSPKIGMTIARVKQCVATVRLVSQMNRADGVVTIYQGGGYTFSEMGGRVTYWSRF